MQTVKIRGDASIIRGSALIPFQDAPGETFGDDDGIVIQIVDSDGQNVGEAEVRSVVKQTMLMNMMAHGLGRSFLPKNKYYY